MKLTSIAKVLESKALFYLVLGINIVYICSVTFIPSMDGPAHLYNSTVLSYLLAGDDFLKEYYSINTIPIPNWISHALLTFLRTLFPASVAEKTLHILYVAGMAVSFRCLIKKINPANSSLSIFIFPFIYSFLFRLGFYNFCISFIFFFSALYVWYKCRSAPGFLNYLVLSILFTATYFSNILMFAFLGTVLGTFVLGEAYQRYVRKESGLSIAKKEGAQMLWLFLTGLPGLVFSWVFYSAIQFPSSDYTLPAMELLKWIYDARPFIVYNYSREKIITIQMLVLLCILWGIGFYHRRKEHQAGLFKINGVIDLLILPLILSMSLLFVTSSGSSAGMMSDRYCLMAYMFGLLWVLARSVPHKYNFIFIAYILVLHFGLLTRHYRKIEEMNARAEAIHQTSVYIEAKSVVLPVNLSDEWLEIHFSNYLGVDKPMVLLENYEAGVGWFPLKWNRQDIPDLYAGEQNAVGKIGWINNPESPEKKQIDYMVLYGDTNKIHEEEYAGLKNILRTSYTKIHTSQDGYVVVYKKN